MADTDVTAQNIIDRSVSRYKDPNKEQWGDQELLQYINKAIDYILKLLVREQSEIGITDGTITVTATQEFTLSGNLDNFWAMADDGVYWSTGSAPISAATYNDKIRNASTTTDVIATSYYITDTTLGLIPIPSTTAVAVDSTLNCRYFAKPTVLAVGDNMPWKNVFNESVSTFMDSMASLRNEFTTAEFNAVYNTLEESALEVIRRRSGL